MKTIIAGSRNGISEQDVQKAINECGWEITEVVCGKAKGADSFGERWAIQNKVPVKEFKPNWEDVSNPNAIIKINKFGKKYDSLAGIRRNHEMGDYAEALVAIWDGKSPGTKDMIHYAKSKGLKVFVYIVK